MVSTQHLTERTLLYTLQNRHTNQATHLNGTFTINLLRSTCSTFGGKPILGLHPHEIGNRSIRSGAATSSCILLYGRTWLSRPRI
jgi:hypothetical protein